MLLIGAEIMLIHSSKELALLTMDQRKKLKFSQVKVGELTGLKQQTISEFEMRPETTRLDTLFRILSALNLDLRIVPKDKAAKTGWKEEW